MERIPVLLKIMFQWSKLALADLSVIFLPFCCRSFLSLLMLTIFPLLFYLKDAALKGAL